MICLCNVIYVGVAFSGWADPLKALQDSSAVQNKLPGTKYISLGGGNENGRFTNDILVSITTAINSNSFSQYQGIVFDIEEGDPGLTSAFSNAFSAAKSKGFRVLVTISHSAPYGIEDAADLMRSFFANSDIDYLSPQLYTTGMESANDFSITAGVNWSEYGASKATVIPSIVKGIMYEDAEAYFRSQGVYTTGYVQWSQTGNN